MIYWVFVFVPKCIYKSVKNTEKLLTPSCSSILANGKAYLRGNDKPFIDELGKAGVQTLCLHNILTLG